MNTILKIERLGAYVRAMVSEFNGFPAIREKKINSARKEWEFVSESIILTFRPIGKNRLLATLCFKEKSEKIPIRFARKVKVEFEQAGVSAEFNVSGKAILNCPNSLSDYPVLRFLPDRTVNTK